MPCMANAVSVFFERHSIFLSDFFTEIRSDSVRYDSVQLKFLYVMVIF